MSQRLFTLHPFSAQNFSANFELSGRIARKASVLELEYIVAGDRSEILLPPMSGQPTRQHDLWQQTCFEFFLGLVGSDRYWEFNLSPTGHWNVYSFEGYRQGMQEELAFTSLPFTVEAHPDTFLLSLKLDLSAIALDSQPIDVAITTVVKHQNEQVSYWALTHTGPEADFHRRDSFVIHL